MDGHLSKPVDMNKLKDMIRAFCAGRGKSRNPSVAKEWL